MVIKFLLSLFSIVFPVISFASSTDDNRIKTFIPELKTVTLTNPVTGESSYILDFINDSALVLNFDIIGDSHDALKLRFQHLNADWTPSGLISSEWLDGINEFIIDDYAYSSGTYVHYVNYSFLISPYETGISKGGNYMIEVFREDDPDSVILSVPFSVSENKTDIHAAVSTQTDKGFNTEWQQLELDVDIPESITKNPLADIFLTVTVNNDPNSERKISSPQSLQGQTLHYSHIPGLIFPAGNDFRRFETVRKDFPGMHVEYVDFKDGIWNARLMTDSPRSESLYLYDQTQYGRFKIDEYDATDPNLGADYVMVEFHLDYPPLYEQNIYVDGDLFNHSFSENNKMEYDKESNSYILKTPLKQGSYNYRYIILDAQGNINASTIEGNFHETSNEYLIKVFLRTPGSRGDILIASSRIFSY